MSGAFIADARGGMVWIHGSDGTAVPVKVLVDSDGHLQLDVVALPTVTVESAGGDKVWGFESIQEEALVNNNLSAGTNNLTGDSVPAGKVWMVYAAVFWYTGTSPTRCQVLARDLAANLVFLNVESPVSDQRYPWTGQLYLGEGESIRGRVEGATAGDDLNVRYAALVMDEP